MPGPGTEKHYAGRYICQQSVKDCRGLFKLCGRWMPCPLWDKCLACRDKHGQLEEFWPVGQFNRLLIKSTPNWTREHQDRFIAAKRAFTTQLTEYFAKYREDNRDVINEQKREYVQRIREKQQKENGMLDEDPMEGHGNNAIGYGMGARHILLPCGEDCRNCPQPEGPKRCPYTDEDEDMLIDIEYKNQRR